MHRAAALCLLSALVVGCGTRVPEQTWSAARGGAAPADAGGAPAVPGAGVATGDASAVATAPGAGGGPDTSAGAGGSAPAAGAGSSTDSTAANGSAGGGSGQGSGAGSAQNTASDVGVTADTIRVGNITTAGGPLGPRQFTPMVQGAKAYFAWRNARGGINGRTVELLECDDRGDPDRNRQCARTLIEDQEVFALVANATRAYAAAPDVSSQGVPDVGGQPIGYQYFTYPGMFAVRGGEYERDGSVGHDGQLYNGTAIFRFLRDELGLERAAVFYYNIPQSKAYGQFHVDALEAEGYEVTAYEVNPALPSFDSHVADMESKGVQAIFDTMDLSGNQNLCQSMERNGVSVEAKVSTVSAWSRRVDEQFPEICKRSLYTWGESIPYTADTEQVATFRQAMTDVHGGTFDDGLHQWHLEGWLAARMFAEGVERMGANVTREGLIEWLNTFTPDGGYGGGGLIVPQSWQPMDYESLGRVRECISVARWDQQAADFLGVGSFPLCDDNSRMLAWTPPS